MIATYKKGRVLLQSGPASSGWHEDYESAHKALIKVCPACKQGKKWDGVTPHVDGCPDGDGEIK